MSSRAFLLLSSAAVAAAALPFLAPASAGDGAPAADIVKEDGSLARYRLLPVQVDPAHAVEVRARLAGAVQADAALPASFQISHSSLPKIRDQGGRGLCAYFAAVGVLESYYIGQKGASRSLGVSTECLADVRDWMFDEGKAYTASDRPVQRPDDNGDFPQRIVPTIAREGVPAASHYSNGVSCAYDGDAEKGHALSLVNYREIMKSGWSAAYGKGLSFTVNRQPTVDGIRKSIAQGHPVTVGIFFYPEFQRSSHWVYDPSVDTNAHISGGHAVMLTGYQTSGGRTTFTFKNSWGSGWGSSGYGTMSDTLLTHSWSLNKDFDTTVSL